MFKDLNEIEIIPKPQSFISKGTTLDLRNILSRILTEGKSFVLIFSKSRLLSLSNLISVVLSAFFWSV